MEETRLHYRARMQRILKDLIEQTPVFTLFDPGVAMEAILCFGVNDWDVPALMKGKVERKGFEWTYSGRTLLFFIFYGKECTQIDLDVGYGPPEILDQLFIMAKDPPFNMPGNFRKKPSKLYTIDRRILLESPFTEKASDEELQTELSKRWDAFMQNIFPKLDAAIKAQQWIL